MARFRTPTSAASRSTARQQSSAGLASARARKQASSFETGDNVSRATRSCACRALPPTVNWFIETKCNYACKFCFATFQDIPSQEVISETERLLQVPAQLQALGADKITFVGGEPLLHPGLRQLVRASKDAGLTTCIVTNASLLDDRLLQELRGSLDWLTVSIDASSDALHARIGRGGARELQAGSSEHLVRAEALAQTAKRLGFKIKLNTVVCAINAHDDMNDLALRLQPDRWKVFKVLPVEGQNDGISHTDVNALLISDAEFEAWLRRHDRAAAAGITIVPENNSQMTGTYAMLDARGRFFSNASGAHEYGPSGFEVGFKAAWDAIAADGGFDAAGFAERGGAYDWAPGAEARATAQLNATG